MQNDDTSRVGAGIDAPKPPNPPPAPTPYPDRRAALVAAALHALAATADPSIVGVLLILPDGQRLRLDAADARAGLEPQ